MAALSTAPPCVCLRYCAQGRGSTLLITAICTLLRGRSEACVLSLLMEACSEPVCLPPLLIAFDLSPQKVSTTTWDRRQKWNSDRSLIGSSVTSLALLWPRHQPAQNCQEALADSWCHSTILPLLSSVDTGGLACGQRGATAQQSSDAYLPPSFRNHRQLTEVSPRRTSFTKRNPSSFN